MMKFTNRDGLWLTLVIVISLAWAADHAFFMACWEMSMPRRIPALRHSGNPYLPSDPGPYEHWAQEMENSDRGEALAKPGFTNVDVPDNRSLFGRIGEVAPTVTLETNQR